MKIRKVKTAKSPKPHGAISLPEAVVPRTEASEENVTTETTETVMEEVVVEEPVMTEEEEEVVIEKPVVTITKLPEYVPPVDVTPSIPVKRARVVVKCASYKLRGRTYTQGQTFEVLGEDNIQQYRSQFFEVYDL